MNSSGTSFSTPTLASSRSPSHVVTHPSAAAASSTRRTLCVVASYWRWPERKQSGNAIDFHTQILGPSLHDTMRALTKT